MIKVKAGKDRKTGADLIVSIPKAITGRHYMLTGDKVIELPINSFVRRRLRKGELVEVKESSSKKQKAIKPDTRFESKPITKGDKE